jgi:hypothetical protein
MWSIVIASGAKLQGNRAPVPRADTFGGANVRISSTTTRAFLEGAVLPKVVVDNSRLVAPLPIGFGGQ